MVQSHLELHVFEIFDLAWPQVLIIDGLASLETALCVEPTVLIELWVVPHFEEDAYLGHYFVTETDVARFDVNTTSTLGVTFFLSLFPNVKFYTTSRIVFFPLRKTAHCFIALRQVSYI